MPMIRVNKISVPTFNRLRAMGYTVAIAHEHPAVSPEMLKLSLETLETAKQSAPSVDRAIEIAKLQRSVMQMAQKVLL